MNINYLLSSEMAFHRRKIPVGERTQMPFAIEAVLKESSTTVAKRR